VLDADGDGVIEYEEWRKAAHKAVIILKPAIILQQHLQRVCFGHKWWARTKARCIPKVSNVPNCEQSGSNTYIYMKGTYMQYMLRYMLRHLHICSNTYC